MQWRVRVRDVSHTTAIHPPKACGQSQGDISLWMGFGMVRSG